MTKEANTLFNLKNPIHFLAVGFGSGMSPKAPGTFGTLAAIPLYLLAINFLTTPWYIVLTGLISIVGISICGKAAESVGVHDHPAIVWDEIAGFFITMLLVPVSFANVLIGFALFRFFDIVKPWPISVLDKKLGGGLGIMLDDILAGILACVLLHTILRFI